MDSRLGLLFRKFKTKHRCLLLRYAVGDLVIPFLSQLRRKRTFVRIEVQPPLYYEIFLLIGCPGTVSGRGFIFSSVFVPCGALFVHRTILSIQKPANSWTLVLLPNDFKNSNFLLSIFYEKKIFSVNDATIDLS